MAKKPSKGKSLNRIKKATKSLPRDGTPLILPESALLSKPPRAFVSYSRLDKDEPIFQALLRDLPSLFGIRLWLDREIKAGDSIIEIIADAIEASDFILHIISKHSGAALWTIQEFQIAYSEQLRVQKAKLIPVKIDSTPIPQYLKSLRIFDLSKDYSKELRNLAAVLVAPRNDSLAKFGIDLAYDNKTIIDISDTVDRALIEYFANNPNEMRTMNRRKFEEIVAELFAGFGYEVELTAMTRDGGRDIIAIKRREVEVKYLIECKRPDPGNYVGIRPVRELYGVKIHEGATKAILATTAHFSPDALLFFEDHKWELEPRQFEGVMSWIEEYLSRSCVYKAT